MKLVNFEVEVLKLLLAENLSQEELNNIIPTCIVNNYEYTGAGYFLEIKCRKVNFAKETKYKPAVMGKIGELEVGFLLFIEKDTLTIECHGWGVTDPPPNIRELDLKIWSEL